MSWRHDAYCDALEAEITRFGDVVRGADLAAPVPTCGEWTLAKRVISASRAAQYAPWLQVTGRSVLLRQVEAQHPDGVAADDLVDHVVGEAGHHLLGHLFGVGPGRVGVRVVGLERDVVDTDLVE